MCFFPLLSNCNEKYRAWGIRNAPLPPKEKKELVPNAQNDVCAFLVLQKNVLDQGHHLLDGSESIFGWVRLCAAQLIHLHFGAQEAWVGITTLPLPGCETLLKLLDLSRPQFLHSFIRIIMLTSAPWEGGRRGRKKGRKMSKVRKQHHGFSHDGKEGNHFLS